MFEQTFKNFDDILHKDAPEFSAYRSPFMENLRRKAAPWVAANPRLGSPQIEPTLKLYVDGIVKRDPRTLAITSAARRARALAAGSMG